MPKKTANEGNTVSAVRKLAEPIAAELGLSIWDIRFLKEGGLWYLRIFIDKPEGISIDDCERMSRAINDPLDKLDPIEQTYCLEVSSPGINRELTRPEHFEEYIDYAIEIRLIRPNENGEKEIAGILKNYDGSVITIEDEDENTILINKKDTSSVHLIEELTEDD